MVLIAHALRIQGIHLARSKFDAPTTLVFNECNRSCAVPVIRRDGEEGRESVIPLPIQVGPCIEAIHQ